MGTAKKRRSSKERTGSVDKQHVIYDYCELSNHIEMGGYFTIALNDDRMIGFAFERASHTFVSLMDEWDVLR